MIKVLLSVVLIAVIVAPITAQDMIAQSQPAIEWIQNNPDDVAFYCDDGETTFAHNADEDFPLASAFKLIVLAEVARQIDAGMLDPESTITRAEMDAYYQPGTDGGAHEAFLESITDTTDALPLAEIARGMIQYSSNAAADILMVRLGEDGLPELYEAIGIQAETLITGTRFEQLQSMESYEGGTAFLPVVEYDRQRAYFVETDFQASAQDMAAVLTYLVENDYSEAARTFLEPSLRWLFEVNPANAQVYEALATKGGSLPGILTGVWYAKPIAGEAITLAAFYRGLDIDTWSDWQTSAPQQFLELRAVAFGEGCAVIEDALNGG